MLTVLIAVTLAQPLDLYGSGPRSIAMAGVQASADDDYPAAYYNPALLRRGAVGAGFNWSAPSMWVTETSRTSPDQELHPMRPVDYAGIGFGAVVPLIGLLRDHVSLGMDLFVPLRHVFRSHIIDEGTPYFLRYDNAPERFQLAMALSVRPVSWLALGAGAQVLSNYGGYAEFNAVLGMAGPGRIVRRRLDSEVLGVFGPTAGVAVGPWRGFKVSAYWRGELKTTFEQPIIVDLGTFGGLDVLVKGVTQYSPHVVGVGFSGTFLDGRLTAGVDVAYERWSATPPLVPDIHIDLPQTLIDLGFNSEVFSRDLQMNFSDTVVPRAGVEYRFLPQHELAVRAGYFFRITPVPEQSGRSNFLDSSAHVVSVGAGWTFDDPLRMAQSLSFDVAAQLTALHSRDVVKDGPNLNPNYRFGGTNLLVNAALKYQF